ncbi:GntR family transcriptional regulator [Janibacter indicus]|uniref:Transcriptional regulator, GntR family n=1 Tax=Janibacter indicus TaxID=857417 RepID=A0A1W2BJX9_9MICO|nr:GntR family transcriptional regulator [Janibacter indicus]SMC73146.1 transcriptional regulator, GntR family [Janibacter indicus]
MSTVRELLSIDPEGADAPFEQVRHQVALLIESGRLVTGERLPSVRGLASDLGLAAGTVARAYRELEADGLVTTARGAGTRVAPRAEADGALVEAAAREYLARVRALGVSDDRAIQVVEIVARGDD